jgi:hypothetical protein
LERLLRNRHGQARLAANLTPCAAISGRADCASANSFVNHGVQIEVRRAHERALAEHLLSPGKYTSRRHHTRPIRTTQPERGLGVDKQQKERTMKTEEISSSRLVSGGSVVPIERLAGKAMRSGSR